VYVDLYLRNPDIGVGDDHFLSATIDVTVDDAVLTYANEEAGATWTNVIIQPVSDLGGGWTRVTMTADETAVPTTTAVGACPVHILSMCYNKPGTLPASQGFVPDAMSVSYFDNSSTTTVVNNWSCTGDGVLRGGIDNFAQQCVLYEPFMYGDANQNLAVFFDDATIVAQVAAFILPPLTGPAFLSGDVNGNGALFFDDATLIAQKSAFLITCFPADLFCSGCP
jgi:hypothetical protein